MPFDKQQRECSVGCGRARKHVMYDVMGTTRIRTCPWTWGLKMEGSVEVQSRRYVARSKRSMRGGVVPSGRTWNAESCRCAHGQMDSLAECGSGPVWLRKGRAGRFRNPWHQPPGTQQCTFFPSPLVPRQCVCNLWSARPAKPASGLGLSSQPMAL